MTIKLFTAEEARRRSGLFNSLVRKINDAVEFPVRITFNKVYNLTETKDAHELKLFKKIISNSSPHGECSYSVNFLYSTEIEKSVKEAERLAEETSETEGEAKSKLVKSFQEMKNSDEEFYQAREEKKKVKKELEKEKRRQKKSSSGSEKDEKFLAKLKKNFRKAEDKEDSARKTLEKAVAKKKEAEKEAGDATKKADGAEKSLHELYDERKKNVTGVEINIIYPKN